MTQRIRVTKREHHQSSKHLLYSYLRARHQTGASGSTSQELSETGTIFISIFKKEDSEAGELNDLFMIKYQQVSESRSVSF